MPFGKCLGHLSTNWSLRSFLYIVFHRWYLTNEYSLYEGKEASMSRLLYDLSYIEISKHCQNKEINWSLWSTKDFRILSGHVERRRNYVNISKEWKLWPRFGSEIIETICNRTAGRVWTKKCRARSGMHSLARHFYVILPCSWVRSVTTEKNAAVNQNITLSRNEKVT